MSKVGSWSTTPGNNNSIPPDGWPEGQLPSTVNDCGRELMAQIRTVFNDVQYFDQNFTPTFISATTFSVAGDQTSAIHAGRRLKIYDAVVGAATVLYATVVTASFTAVTTIQVANDAGGLTSSLSSFAIAILSNTNDSLPRKLAASYSSVATDNLVVNGTTTASGAVSLLTTLSVSGAAVLNSTLSVSGAAAFATTLTVSGATSLLTTLSVSGATVLKSALSVGGATVLASTLTVGGALVASGAARFDSTLSVSGTAVAANIAKVWATLSMGGAGATPGIIDSFNVSAVSRVSSGIFRLAFISPLASSAMSVFVTSGQRGVAGMFEPGATTTTVDFSFFITSTEVYTDPGNGIRTFVVVYAK